jgi:hypothetical protein
LSADLSLGMVWEKIPLCLCTFSLGHRLRRVPTLGAKDEYIECTSLRNTALEGRELHI